MEGSGWHSECVGRWQVGVRCAAKWPIELIWRLREPEEGRRCVAVVRAGRFVPEVDDVDATLATKQAVPIVAPEHKTFYGSTEFTVEDQPAT